MGKDILNWSIFGTKKIKKLMSIAIDTVWYRFFWYNMYNEIIISQRVLEIVCWCFRDNLKSQSKRISENNQTSHNLRLWHRGSASYMLVWRLWLLSSSSTYRYINLYLFYWRITQWLEFWSYTSAVVGSSPTSPTMIFLFESTRHQLLY